jgi:signal peptidase II
MLQMFASGGLLLLLDQWSKRTVQLHVRGRSISCGPILRIRFVTNLRAIYGRGDSRVALVLIWFTALLSAIILHRSGAWFQSHVALFGLGLAIGGAAGNLLDILRWRYVVDFIDLRWWPVFNLADVAIIVGLVLALWRQA